MPLDEDRVSTAVDGAHFVDNPDVEVGGDRRTTIDSIEMLAFASEESGPSTIKRNFLANRNKHHKTRPWNMGGLKPECFDFQDDAVSSFDIENGTEQTTLAATMDSSSQLQNHGTKINLRKSLLLASGLADPLHEDDDDDEVEISFVDDKAGIKTLSVGRPDGDDEAATMDLLSQTPKSDYQTATTFQSLFTSWTADSSFQKDDDEVEIKFDDTSVTDTLSVTHHDGDDRIGGFEENKVKLKENEANPTPLTATKVDVLTTVSSRPVHKASVISSGLTNIEKDWLPRKLQYVYVFAMLYVTPVCIAIYAPIRIVAVVYFMSIACVVFVNCWMLFEAFSSFRYTSQLRKLHHSSPEIIGEKRLGSIVVAYLPNELTVLVDTIRAVANTMHELPSGTTLDIVLAHNGGRKDQRIALLEDLRKIEPELPVNVCVHELDVLTSRSKAENVNAALAFFQELSAVRGEIFTHLSIYDSDHQPIPQAWRYALETMQDQQADMVMGRCCVREGLKYVAIEFDILYAIGHAGGRYLRGFGFFGGSNGYWDYTTLVETGMDQGMLTEDIDSSFRAQASGRTMTYDPTIVSFEESPPDFAALFKQRLRWAQGWYEVTIRQFFLPFQDAPGLTLWSRFCIFLLLPFREIYVYLSSFTVPIAVVYLTRACGWVCVDYRLLALLILCMQVPVIMTLSAWYLTKDRTNNIHYRMASLRPLDYFKYILLSFPYELFKIHVTVMAHARHAMGLNKWVVTKRKTTKDPTAAIFTPAADTVANPDELVAYSPYAPPARQLSSGTYYLEDENTWVHYTTSQGSCPFRQNMAPIENDTVDDQVIDEQIVENTSSTRALVAAQYHSPVRVARNDQIRLLGTCPSHTDGEFDEEDDDDDEQVVCA